ncbi:hypothetical protein SEA_PARADIDDLES_222 [Streptomyces phage Paradiddles]|uniref:DUF7455 domain-containing protein n=3 Tax=Samistivirus TaxID=2560220 RepID=A0A514U273_9CAUD|nr:hypothetical protein FDI36_gp071 [Streptomyces phage NootNoot]YP_009611173.1 hypothetical protein FDI37_gp072 [Streptomyces phage Paradiddles]YP_010104081.1 hypothetical protein KNU71_gp075 [Streptomyces phage Braelyn]ASR77450.1 hypothetical protein SEA_NOOTNOOT_227 [Streptomyces phage NootNoot]ASR77651.1 hypothetical protein SEA_PARADIDDLES_222 [Streptomyces phage Paradiddles]QDK03042.1 hypothetical protein SEA_BRAELYN_226 [Streptomyces phage Braelyn]
MEAVMERPLRKTEDRCDRCNAQAFVIAEKGDMALLFCGHHGKQYKQALEMQGWGLLDFTDEIG